MGTRYDDPRRYLYNPLVLLERFQPVRHAHLAVHRRRGRQVLLGLPRITGPPVEPAEAVMAVGHERAHLQLGGQAQCGIVMSRGRRDIGAGLMRDDVA